MDRLLVCLIVFAHVHAALGAQVDLAGYSISRAPQRLLVGLVGSRIRNHRADRGPESGGELVAKISVQPIVIAELLIALKDLVFIFKIHVALVHFHVGPVRQFIPQAYPCVILPDGDALAYQVVFHCFALDILVQSQRQA